MTLDDWFARRHESFAKGDAHTETLPGGELSLASDALAQLIELAHAAPEPLTASTVIPMSPAQKLDPAPLELSAVTEHIDAGSPAVLVVEPPTARAKWESYELYRCPLNAREGQLPDGVRAYVSSYRTLPDRLGERPYARSLVLEWFPAAG
jgi:hypothetical protein